MGKLDPDTKAPILDKDGKIVTEEKEIEIPMFRPVKVFDAVSYTHLYPYWSWYGFDSRVEWCACFVSWCYNQAGKSEPRLSLIHI